MSRHKRPHIVFWELTDLCNLRCPHCRRSCSQADAMDSSQTSTILSHLACWPGTKLVLSGGEPTLRDDLLNVIDQATGFGLEPLLATNATTVEDGLSGRLWDRGVRTVSVSLQGPTPEQHDSMTAAPGSFEAALRGLRSLQKAGIRVQINSVITEASFPWIEPLAHLARALDAVAFHLFLFVPTGQATVHHHLVPLKSKLLEFFPKAKDLASRAGLPVRLTCCPQFLSFLDRTGFPVDERMAGCGAGRSVLFVSSQGKVFPCGYFPLEVGDLLRQEGSEIWEGSDMLRRLADPAELQDGCGLCDHRALCGGCRARAYAVSGNPFTQDPACPWLLRREQTVLFHIPE